MRRPFKSIDNFFGCIKCGKYHICDASSTDCLLMDEPNSEYLICRFSGRTMKGTANYGIASFKEGADVEYKHYCMDFESFVNRDITINIQNNNSTNNNNNAATPANINNTSLPPLQNSTFTLNVHQNKDGSTNSFIKKKSNRGAGGGAIIPLSSSSSSPLHNRNDNGGLKKKKKYNPEDFINVTSNDELTEKEKLDLIRNLALQPTAVENGSQTMTTTSIVVATTKTTSIGGEGLSNEEDYLSYYSLYDIGSNKKKKKKKKKKDFTVNDEDEDEEEAASIAAFKKEYGISHLESNQNRLVDYDNNEDDPYDEYDSYGGNGKNAFYDMEDDQDSGDGGEYDNDGGGGSGGSLSGINYDPYGSVYADFKETLLESKTLYHNNIHYWTEYYSWISLYDIENDKEEGGDNEKQVGDSIDSLISKTYKDDKPIAVNDKEREESDDHSTSSSSVNSKSYRDDDQHHKEEQEEEEEEQEESKQVEEEGENNNDDEEEEISPSFRNSLSDEVYCQIDEEVSRILMLLICIYYEEVDNGLKNDILMDKHKQYQQWVTKLKTYYMPFIARIIILLYNSPYLIEWEKERNEKRQKQVKSSASTKVGVIITNLNHLEEIEKTLENSKHRILCPKKVTASLLLKHFIDEFYLDDPDGNRITIWSKDLWLETLNKERIIEYLLSDDFKFPSSFVNYTSYTTTTSGSSSSSSYSSSSSSSTTPPITVTSILNSYGDRLRKNVNKYAKDIRNILKYYNSDPLWLKAFIFD